MQFFSLFFLLFYTFVVWPQGTFVLSSGWLASYSGVCQRCACITIYCFFLLFFLPPWRRDVVYNQTKEIVATFSTKLKKMKHRCFLLDQSHHPSPNRLSKKSKKKKKQNQNQNKNKQMYSGVHPRVSTLIQNQVFKNKLRADHLYGG